MNKKILVTGGAGYIGAHICKALKQSGFDPVVFDNLSNGYEEHVKWGKLVIGDVNKQTEIDEALKNTNPIAVIHMAGLIEAGVSVRDPLPFYKTNIGGTINLLKSMNKYSINNIIFSSTAALYKASDNPLTESSTILPLNPYGNSKLCAEMAIKDAKSAYGINYSSLRYFNAAGADIDCEIGEKHNPESHLIPLTIMAGQANQPEFLTFGNDYPTDDGTPIRDFIHVTDLACAHILALENLLKTQKSDIFNVGTGKGHSVREVVNTAFSILKVNTINISGDRRPGDPSILVANCDKIKSQLGWDPRYSDLKTIIKSAANWHKKTS